MKLEMRDEKKEIDQYTKLLTGFLKQCWRSARKGTIRERKKVVKITYTFEVSYHHPTHLNAVIEELKRYPGVDISGVEKIDGEMYKYGSRRIGKGK